MDFKHLLLGIEKRLKFTDPVKEQSNRYLKRFQEFSFNGCKCIDEKQYEAVITRWCHTIEKGLSYLNYRAGFGKQNIDFLLTSMENYIEDGYSKDMYFFQTALSVLKMYVEKNKQFGLEKPSLEERIRKLGGNPNESGGVICFEPLDEKAVQSIGYKEFVQNRHSMRHFSDQPLDLEVVKKALMLAQHTPSACNRQGWRCIIISNKNTIANVLKNQNGNRGFGQEFDKLLLVTADLRCFNRDREIFQAYIDGGMYAQSILNALHYYHIASVPLSGSLTKEQESNVRKIVGFDEAEVIIMFIGVGNYPDVCQTARSERYPVNDIEII